MSPVSKAILVFIFCVIHLLPKVNCNVEEYPSNSNSPELIRNLRSIDPARPEAKVKLCGSRLIDAVKRICPRIYQPSKRNSIMNHNERVEQSQLGSRRITEECCSKGACSYQTLTKYCNEDIISSLRTTTTTTTTTPAPTPNLVTPFEILNLIRDFFAKTGLYSINGHETHQTKDIILAPEDTDEKNSISKAAPRVNATTRKPSYGEREPIPESNIYRDIDDYDQRYFTEGF